MLISDDVQYKNSSGKHNVYEIKCCVHVWKRTTDLKRYSVINLNNSEKRSAIKVMQFL